MAAQREKKILGEELFKQVRTHQVVICTGALPEGIQERPRQEGESRFWEKQFWGYDTRR